MKNDKITSGLSENLTEQGYRHLFHLSPYILNVVRKFEELDYKASIEFTTMMTRLLLATAVCIYSISDFFSTVKVALKCYILFISIELYTTYLCNTRLIDWDSATVKRCTKVH